MIVVGIGMQHSECKQLKGASGVNIEPEPSGVVLLNKFRSRDVNLKVGIGKNMEEQEADFYVMSSRRLNTLVKDEAMRIQATSKYLIKKVESIKLLAATSIFNNYFSGASPDFISLDVEGFDLEILKTIVFALHRPKVICVETIIFQESMPTEKNQELIEFLLSNNYFIYADTFINTIFVDRSIWNNKLN